MFLPLLVPSSSQYVWSTITPTGTITARRGASAVYYNNAIYVIGGYSGAYLGDVQKFDVTTNTWSSVTTTGTFTGRVWFTATLYNDVIYVIAGQTGSGVRDNAAYKFTIATSTWTTLNPTGTLVARSDNTATLYNDNIYIIGGYGDDVTYQRNDVVKYSITYNSWTTITTNGITLPDLEAHTATLYKDEIYVIGGKVEGGALSSSVHKLTIATSTWTTVAYAGTFTGRWGHSAYRYKDIIYVIAGKNSAGAYLNDINMYDIATSTWTTITATGTLIGRWFGASAYYNNVIYVIAGDGGSYLNDVVTLTNLPTIGIIIIITIIIIIIAVYTIITNTITIRNI